MIIPRLLLSITENQTYLEEEQSSADIDQKSECHKVLPKDRSFHSARRVQYNPNLLE
jgi:hypothetical protein